MATKVERVNTRHKISIGVNLLGDAVGDTMGPGGQSVLLETAAGMPIVTKDGVTVANAIELEDPELNIVARIVRQAADKTNREAGDGTTTATVLTKEIYNEGYKLVAAGHNSTVLKKEMDEVKPRLIQALDAMASQITEENKIETLAHIAKISLNGEEKMSKIIADAVAKTGVYGLIKVQENTLPVDELVTVKGLSFPAGYASPFFADRNDNKITLENCAVLITSHKLTNLHQMAALEQTLTHFAKKNIPVLFVASEVSGPFLTNLVANQKQGSLKNCALRPPYFGVVRKEFFTDLACLVDATIIEADEKMELDQVLPQHLGFAKRVEVNNLETTIIEGSGKKEVLAVRTQALQELASKVDKEQDLDKVHERLAKLTEGVMLIKIARESQVENEERKHRIEDALNACKAALEQGYVSGGGAALYYLFKHLDSKIPGQNLLIKALQYPAKKILSNAGFSDRELHPLEQGKSELTVNAKTGKQVDAYAEGIIDPVKVTKAALNNAISVAGVLLTTNVLISRIPEAPSPMPYQMY